MITINVIENQISGSYGDTPFSVNYSEDTYKKMKELGAIENFNELPTDAQHKHNTAMSLCGLLHNVSTKRSFKKIEGKIVRAGNVLPPLKTMELFLSDNPVKKGDR